MELNGLHKNLTWMQLKICVLGGEIQKNVHTRSLLKLEELERFAKEEFARIPQESRQSRVEN